MKTKLIHLFTAASLFTMPLLLTPHIILGQYQSIAVATQMSDLTDVPSNHWAYESVKNITENLDLMPPKGPNQFMGKDVATRYELAEILYKAAKKLETISGKDLRAYKTSKGLSFADVDDSHKMVVNSIVNEYGIMEGMPGGKFMGNEAISRYELAAQLNNYFKLLETKLSKSPALANRGRSGQLKDLPPDHWATPAAKNILDIYQIMDGYTDNTFKGGQKLTRYEVAAVLKKFVDYVNVNIIPLFPAPTPSPTAKPTPMPTPKPTPVPTATPVMKKPLSTWDIKVGGTFRLTGADKPSTSSMFGPTNAMLFGPAADVDVWFPKLGWARLGVGLTGEYLFYEAGRFNTENLSALSAGGTLNWRILGADSDEDVSLVLSLGYSYLQQMGQNPDPVTKALTAFSYSNHGPRAELGLEIPIGPWLSLFAHDAFTYFPFKNSNFTDNIEWKNDAFVGLNIPAYSLFSVQLGYRDTRYSITGRPNILGDMGATANLRFRF